MNHALQPQRLHPALLVAAVTVSAFALAGIGVLTGVIPSSFGTATTPPPVIQPASETAVVPSVPQEPAATASTAAPAPTAPTAPTARPAPAKPPVAKAAKAAKPAPTRTAAAANAEQPLPAAPVAVICKNCGAIESIREIAHDGDGSGLGAVAGGVVGAVLGNQVGGGRGKSAATLLGGIGGAVAGHQIEKSQKKRFTYEIVVRFDDGTSQVLTQETAPSWRLGDRVKLVNGTLTGGA